MSPLSTKEESKQIVKHDRPISLLPLVIIFLVDKMHSSLDISLEVRSVFLDMSKALDMKGYFSN